MAPSLPFEAFLQVRTANGGSFSPNGRALAFLMNCTGVPQVHRADWPGQEPQALTAFPDIVRSVCWSPDGARLLFSMDCGGNERHQLWLMDADGANPRCLTPHPEAIHTFGGWAPDARRVAFSSNRRDPAFFDVYLLDVDTGEEQCVVERNGHFTPVEWSPDGSLLLVRETHASLSEDLHLLDVATGDFRLVTPHTGSARYVSPRFLPDNRTLLVCTDQDRDFLALARLDTRLLRLRRVLERRVDVESCDISADGRRVVALINRDGWSEVVVARLGDRSLSALVNVTLTGVATECRLSRDGSRIAISMHGPTFNANVWEMEPDSTARVQWTRASLGDLDPSLLVEPRSLRYPSHDGLEIPAFLYRPRNAGTGPVPTIVHIHGGPESQDRPGFSPVYQYLLHRGYAVLAPNVRGSTGYGNAYCHLDDREKRYDALRDVEYAHHWLVGSGLAAPHQIGIMGASYGGFTVLACLTRQPDLWAAGVDIVGVANFETFFQHTGPWRRGHRASEYGDPVADRDLLRNLSPIHAVDKIRAPLMVVQGANDPRVPQEESDQIVEQLRARQHPVEYLLFPDEGHGIVKLPNRIRAYTAIGEFLDRYLSV